jgi:uncharacterized protein YuzE
MMQIDYDAEADALYIRLRAGDVADTRQADKYIFVDVDEEGIPLGIEILFAGRLLTQNGLTSVTVNLNQPTLPTGIEPVLA